MIPETVSCPGNFVGGVGWGVGGCHNVTVKCDQMSVGGGGGSSKIQSSTYLTIAMIKLRK